MANHDGLLTDQQMLAVTSGEWPLPEEGNGICSRWIDAFVATRLQDVLARRFYQTPFPKLSAEDRAAIRIKVEAFVEQMAREFDETHIERVVR